MKAAVPAFAASPSLRFCSSRPHLYPVTAFGPADTSDLLGPTDAGDLLNRVKAFL
jgi:hypothetical protein